MNRPTAAEILDAFCRYAALGFAITLLPFFIIAITAALTRDPAILADMVPAR